MALKTTETKITFSNGAELPYNPYIFNRDSVIAYSIQEGKWKVTEELLLRLIPFLSVVEINFAGKNQVIVKTVENFYIELKFTDKKVTSVRVIQFFKCKNKGLELVPYKSSRGYLPLDELPVSYEHKVSISLNDLELELGAIVSTMLMKFHDFGFEMDLD